MFEHFFDANSPCAGLVSATDPCPCTGLPPLVLFGRGYVFAKDMRTEGPPITGRVIKFHKGALFNATSQSLLPALVFGTQMQSANALNITAIVSDAVHTSIHAFAGELDDRGTLAADASDTTASVLLMHTPRPSKAQPLQLDDGYGRTSRHHSRCSCLGNFLVRHPHIAHQTKKVGRCCGCA
jgi:hypothetical protein